MWPGHPSQIKATPIAAQHCARTNPESRIKMPSRQELANAIRALSMDAVEAANSGHPGMPMGMADIAEVLWNDFLAHNPADPHWCNRDRFVVSNGHGSMLLYSLLHLSGYDVPLEELRNFRQFHSMTPGHPERGDTPGVETTTGPLGQGLANAVGMAIAEKILAARYNRPDFDVVDHRTWVFLGDGCLMEGISHEACSLAGTLGLGKLVAFWDDNGISIDGEVDGWFTDDTPARFRAYGWHVIADVDGHDPGAVSAAIEQAISQDERPTLICCRTVIGQGAPNKQGTEAAHGAALGADEVAAARESLGWSHPPFEIPDDIRDAWDNREQGRQRQAEWDALFERYREAHPEAAAELARRLGGELPAEWAEAARELIRETDEAAAKVATRKASQKALDTFGPLLPELVGGSADLAGSNGTLWSGARGLTTEQADANYIYFGVREFAMSAIVNGMALHGGFIPYGATFLVFSDYARNAVRMSALMGVGSIFVYTHDSIGLGEDGPTHQPVEHLASLRMIPNLQLWRPCDAVESMVSWQAAVERRDGPSVLVFSRQGLAHQPRDAGALEGIRRGGYVLRDCEGTPQAVIMATGSEVTPAVEAAGQLEARGVRVRVVSMPCTRVFDEQDKTWRDSVLPPEVTARVAVEAGVSDFWYRYVGTHGRVVGMDTFGASAPAGDLFEHFGFTVDNLVRAVEEVLT